MYVLLLLFAFGQNCETDADCPPPGECFEAWCDLATHTCQQSATLPCCVDDAACPADGCHPGICDRVTSLCALGDCTIQTCLGGPGVAADPDCAAFDTDADGDVDLQDVASLAP